MATIQSLFSSTRPIDRQIEKVIDYSAQDEDRLATEISEYEITDNIERCYRRFLDVFSEGVRGGRVTETGIWVSGFYGSGKSSFTKYLGFALEGERKKVRGKPFLELLSERFVNRNTIQAELLTLVRQHSTVVIFLDLGSEQLSESAATPVSTVLYWKVLQWAGFSKEKKPIGVLACVDDFYNTLREDIGQVYPHVVSGADKVVRIFSHDAITHRVAKAVAALQPIDTFPRTAENIAALLYPELGSPSLLDDVQQALKRILNEKECGLIEDPQAGGYVFLSESVRPLRDKRTY